MCLPKGETRGWVMLIHGVAEHSGRYSHVVSHLNAAGFAVFAFDAPGHGRSAVGRPEGLIGSPDDLIKDVQQFLQWVLELAAGRPCFFLGHSMGALVLAYYLIRQQSPQVAGAILTGIPLVPAGHISRVSVACVEWLGRICSRFPTIRLDSRFISRDPSVVDAYDSDPLVFRRRLPAGTGAEILRMLRFVREQMHKIKAPLLIMHGTGDRIARVEGSRQLFAGVTSEDKSLRLWEGLFHEIMNEPESERVLDEIVAWMKERC